MAPLYFQGKIGFGVINQSSSAFNHILSDVSLVVYQVSADTGVSMHFTFASMDNEARRVSRQHEGMFGAYIRVYIC